MKIKKMLPALCLALGLAFALPMAAGATKDTEATEDNTQKATNKWYYEADGRRYFLKADGTKAVGFQFLPSNPADASSLKLLYYFQEDGYLMMPQAEGKVKIGDDYYYCRGAAGNYSLMTKSWSKDGKYLAASDGKLYKSVIVKVNNRIYGFNSQGTKWQKAGRYRLNGEVYYNTTGGYLVTNKWQKIGKRSYFFDTNGRMTGFSKAVKSGKTYYYRVDTSKSSLPVIRKKGWYTDSGKRYYVTSSTGRLATGFKTIEGKRYYFNTKNGSLVKNTWIRKNKKVYRANSKGVVYTGWFKVASKRYYADSTGARQSGLETINNKTYYFNRLGVMQTGWQTVKGGRYYFDPKLRGYSAGSARTGWFNVSNKTYYANSTGKILTGWVYYNGSRYYLDPKDGGAAIKSRNNVDIGGTRYSFDSQGRQIGFSPSGPKVIKVNRQQNVVTVYQGDYPVKVFLCSTGLNNATPVGTFRILDKLPMHELNGPTWGFYCSHITSDILFHSMPGDKPSHYAFPAHKYNLLGQAASQGCIRLRMGDAYWIYNNCPIGTKVIIYDSSDPGPLGKPTYKKIPENLYVDPTDPTDSRFSSYA